jgi:hypothetical protein
MALARWQLVRGRPVIRVSLRSRTNGSRTPRLLLADTGAGSALTRVELILLEADCRRFGTTVEGPVRLGGALSGTFPTYWVPVTLPELQFVGMCRVAAVPTLFLPPSFQGIACFRFLNRFTYGNFGDPDRFGLELPE